MSSASRVHYGRCIAAQTVLCRTRRARRSRCARRPPCYAVPCYGRAHSCATGPLTRASRAGVALRASVATRPPQRWKGPPEERASAQRILPDKISGTPRIMICVRGAPCELRMLPELISGAPRPRICVTNAVWSRFVTNAVWSRFVTNAVWSRFVTYAVWSRFVTNAVWSRFVAYAVWSRFVTNTV